MIVKEFANTSLPYLQEKDTAKKALSLMKDFKLENVVVHNAKQFGVISFENIQILPQEATISKANSFFRPVSISEDDHIWEALRAFHEFETCVLPVVSNKNKYIGSISIWEIIDRVYEIFPVNNGGAILQLEMLYANYSLSELANIIEGSNSKITMLSLFPIANSNRVAVVFCIDKTDASETIQALDRHGYNVDSWFMDKGKIDKLMEERYSAFMNYINI